MFIAAKSYALCAAIAHKGPQACHFDVPWQAYQRATQKNNSIPCRYINLVAKQAHSAGDSLLLDYGDKPLQDMLLQYGFVPDTVTGDTITESFEDLGSSWEGLLVQSANLVSQLANRKPESACLNFIHHQSQFVYELMHYCGLHAAKADVACIPVTQ